MKFYKNNTNPTHSNPLTLMRENYKYEVVDMVNNKVAFTNRMPRKDSNFFNFNFLIWNLKENALARGQWSCDCPRWRGWANRKDALYFSQ